jgi:hypothetical protein
MVVGLFSRNRIARCVPTPIPFPVVEPNFTLIKPTILACEKNVTCRATSQYDGKFGRSRSHPGASGWNHHGGTEITEAKANKLRDPSASVVIPNLRTSQSPQRRDQLIHLAPQRFIISIRKRRVQRADAVAVCIAPRHHSGDLRRQRRIGHLARRAINAPRDREREMQD